MTQAAYIIRLAPPRQPNKRRESGTYTTTDKAVVEYQKRNGSAASRTLTTLSERSNFAQRSSISIAEIQVETGLGQRAVEKALAVLESQGFCSKVGKLWGYTNPNADANEKANSRSHERSDSVPRNIVLDSKKKPLKEVEGSRRKKNNTSEASTVDHRTTDVGAESSNTELRTSNTSPDGAASGEARQAASSPVVLENTHQEGGNVNVTGSEKVPPPAATPFRAALNAIDAAGLTPTWVQWIKLNRLAQVSQEAQIAVWHGWIDAGLTEQLRVAAADIVESGSFAHPWGGLKARMQKAQAAQAVQQQVAATFGEAAVSPGQRRIAPDGRVWTVEVVEFGIVYFEEVGAPTDLGDRIVARWALEVSHG